MGDRQNREQQSLGYTHFRLQAVRSCLKLCGRNVVESLSVVSSGHSRAVRVAHRCIAQCAVACKHRGAVCV